MLRLDLSNIESFLSKPVSSIQDEVQAAHQKVLGGTGAGSDFLGWRDLLLRPDDALLENITSTAARIREDADVLVCIGIGGSYLGAKAVIQALTPQFGTGGGPEVLFAGHHMSGAYLRELMGYLEGKSVYLNVISKSGTTLEPALTFRFLRTWMEAHFEDSARRIIATTDPESGALKQLSDELGYKTYKIAPDIGGRFSVLTPVGLLPIAVAGVDIRSLFYGAASAIKRFDDPKENAANDYAAARYLLNQQGYGTEVFAVFEPRLSGIGQWWQQLYGESEGKEGKGLFPASVQYSTDLHSLGQFMQEGPRNLIETFLMAEEDGGNLPAPSSEANLDGLNYLAGMTLTEINRKAYEGTAQAHTNGEVPNMTLWIDRISADVLGECLYFFEHAVAVSGYLLGVNPFNQPGVEAYKKEMFRLLGKG